MEDKPIKIKKGALTKLLEAISPETKSAFLRIEYVMRDAGFFTTAAVFNDKSNAQKMDCRWGRREGGYQISWGFQARRVGILTDRKAYAFLTFFFRSDDPDFSRRDDSIILEFHPERGWIVDLFFTDDDCPPEIAALLVNHAGTRMTEGQAEALIAAIVKRFLQRAADVSRSASSVTPANDNDAPSDPPPDEPLRPAS